MIYFVSSHCLQPTHTSRLQQPQLLCMLYSLPVLRYTIIIIIIIITLFQEDNIFGRVASLTYGPQLTNVGHDIIKMNRHACTIIYSMYRVNALRTPSRLRAGYPTLLQWRGRYDFSRLKTSRVLPHTSVLVIECFLTRSMLFLKCIYTHYIQSFFSPAQYQKRYLS